MRCFGTLVPEAILAMNLPREQRVVVEKELSQGSSPPLGKIRFTSNIVVTKPQEGLLLFFFKLALVPIERLYAHLP